MQKNIILNQNNRVLKKTYRSFCGVDLTSAVTEVDSSRSPDAPNMIADASGFPEKRTGVKPVYKLGSRINGIHGLKNGLIAHAGTKLYLCENGSVKLLYSDCADERSASFNAFGSLYILDGKRLLKYADGKITAADESAYIPTTQISAPPEGGGTAFEPINLLSDYRTNAFLGKSGALVYQLDAAEIDGIKKAEIKDASGVWRETTAFSCDNDTGRITFETPPGAPAQAGEDNVRITYKRVVAKYKERINSCTIAANYGLGGDTRVFLAGGANPNYDYCCAQGSCEYFPDLNYSVIGSGSAPIMGYLHKYESLVIVKENSREEPSVYFRTAYETPEGKAAFQIMPSLSGAGAISKRCFSDLADDNIFLSEQGLMGLSCSSVTLERSLQNRSYYINRALLKEPALANAVGCLSGSKYFIFINNKAYVADLTQKCDNKSGSFGYEWFYFEDVPARVAASVGGVLYMGTNSDEVRVFRDEADEGMEAYNDIDGAGEARAVKCRWSTKADALSDSAAFKKIMKRGTGAVIKPFANTSGTICYMHGYEEEAAFFSLTTAFDFNDVDFNDFCFGVSQTPYFVPARKKKRKAKMWQMIIKNEELSSAMGIYEIRVNFKEGAYIKR